MYQLGVIHIIQILDFEVTLCDTYTLFTQHNLTGFSSISKSSPFRRFANASACRYRFAVFRTTGNDQRRSGFIDQNGIDLIDDCDMQPAQHAVLHIGNHIVAQIIKSQLGVCGICNITVKCITLLRWCQRAGVYTDTQAQEPVNLSHPFRITACQIVVDSNNVYPLPLKAFR